ncbi:uncharacterized protein LOC110039053 isoform X2 [Phalaenopsis equestris]|nr:uncharacterized protein LOC110039053 isoform X2 [Phalaenopsis equestris]
MKSFMAPTICASSKITAASPRKKILLERNQVVRDCMENNVVSAEEVKGGEIKQKPEIDFDSEEISIQNRSRKLDFSSTKSYYQLSATGSLDAADSDADPSFPPYDPMKNYLSPRPRFLHYKPNPRIEQHHEFTENLLYMGDARRLEDSFSDSEGSEDCSGYTEQSSPLREPDYEILMKTQEALAPEENHVFESNPRPEKYKPKASWTGRFKLIPFLLVFSVFLVSVPLIDSPILSHFTMKDQSLAATLTRPLRFIQDIHLYDYLDVASRNLQGLATRMRQWSINSIHFLISSGSFSKEPDISHSLNTSLLSMAQSATLDFCSRSDFVLPGQDVIFNRQNDLLDYIEMAFEHDKADGETLMGKSKDVSDKPEVVLFQNVIGDSTELLDRNMEENNNLKYNQLNSFTDPAVQFGSINNIDQIDKNEIAISEEFDGEGDMEEQLEEQVLIELEEHKIHPFNKEDINSTVYPADETQISNKKNFDTVPYAFSNATLLMLVVLGMFVSVALATKLISFFINIKKNTPTSDEKLLNKKIKSVSDGAKSCRHANGDFCCNRLGLAEMVCDSGPTEMSSSFNNHLSFSKQMSKIESHDVTPSQENMQRRESGVSSSIPYGSFTSYEKRSRKGKKQEEVVTPIRRSIGSQISGLLVSCSYASCVPKHHGYCT